MKAATKTQLETLVRKMDSLSGEFYVEAHAETLALRDRLEAKGADWHHLSPAAAWGIDSLLEAVAR